MIKQLGIIIWCGAFFGFASLFISELNNNSENNGMIFVFALALIAYLPLILYNWLWGDQKGHRIHFIAIIFSGYLSVIFWFRKELGLPLYGIAIIWFFIIMFIAVKRYRPGIMADYKNGIKRDHFTNLNSRR